MTEKVYKEIVRFPSSSSAGKFYVVKADQEGNLSVLRLPRLALQEA
jgi:hypothetical protein